MRVLLLSQWYLPEPQRVVSDLAESLRDEGLDVTVLTGFPNYPEGELYPGYRLRLFQRETINGVPLVRVPLFPDHSRSPLKRAWNFISFALAAALIGFWLVPRADLVYVVHPPLTVGGPAWLFSRLWRVPFVYEIQDMWPETLRATGMVSNRRVLDTVAWFAKRVYARAAALRVISPGFKRNLVEKGVAADKVAVHSNWVDTEFYKPVAPDPALADELGLTGKFNVMYAGALGLAQGLDTVLDAAERLSGDPDVQFVLVGDGADADRLREEVSARGLTNVLMPGRFPGEAMSDLYALADVLLIHLKDDPLFRITIPHKTFAYLASGKPVLAAVAGDVAEVVRTADAGLVCPPADADAMAGMVERFRAMTPDQRQRIGTNGRAAACRDYARERITAQIAAMLRRVAEGRGPIAADSAPQATRAA